MNFTQPAYVKTFYTALLALGLVWIGVSRVPEGATTAGQIPAPQVGFLAPDFTLRTPGGKPIRLSDLHGKVILVNIWATWCPPCRAEMPAMERTYNTYKDQGFVVLAVDSTIQDALPNVSSFIDEYKLTFPVLLDESGEVTRLYRVQSLPTSFFIGADGIIREVVIGGPMSEALLQSRVEELLKEVH